MSTFNNVKEEHAEPLLPTTNPEAMTYDVPPTVWKRTTTFAREQLTRLTPSCTGTTATLDEIFDLVAATLRLAILLVEGVCMFAIFWWAIGLCFKVIAGR